MRRTLIIVATTAAILLNTAPALADSPRVVSGGGTGSWDPAGTEPASQFGFGVVSGASVRGFFECVMAGRSAAFGLKVMKVEGRVSWAVVNTSTGVATFGGSGKLRADSFSETVTFEATVQAGGPGAGTLQLTIFGSSLVGAVFALPPETVASGRIDVQ